MLATVLPEIRLRAAGVVPPMTMFEGPSFMRIPKKTLGSADEPEGSVPMKFPSSVTPEVAETRMPA